MSRQRQERRKISLGSSPSWMLDREMMVLRTPEDKVIGTVDVSEPGVDLIRISERGVELAGREGISFGHLVCATFDVLAERAEQLKPFEEARLQRVQGVRKRRTVGGLVSVLRNRAGDWDRRLLRWTQHYRVRPSPPWSPESEADKRNRF